MTQLAQYVVDIHPHLDFGVRTVNSILSQTRVLTVNRYQLIGLSEFTLATPSPSPIEMSKRPLPTELGEVSKLVSRQLR
jgi:hypothetical protein